MKLKLDQICNDIGTHHLSLYKLYTIIESENVELVSKSTLLSARAHIAALPLFDFATRDQYVLGVKTSQTRDTTMQRYSYLESPTIYVL